MRALHHIREKVRPDVFGAIVGACIGLQLNEMRIANTNGHVISAKKENIPMPKYPPIIHAGTAVFSGLYGAALGRYVGYALLPMYVCAMSASYAVAYLYHEHSKYDAACADAYKKHTK